MNENDQHHWSGWPGAFCYKCGASDPNELALADGLWGFDEDPTDPNGMKEVWTGTPEQKTALDAAMVCPVKGKLVWNEQDGIWDLIPPRQFCTACGAGIGEFRRVGEGTCHVCDPEGCAAHARCNAALWQHHGE